MAEFAKIFKKLRLERELSQSRLADQLGISKSAVNMYERGDRRPDFETAEVIADFFNVDMNYLLEPARRYSNPEDHRAAGLCRPQNCRIKQKSPGGCRGSLSLSCICWLL